MARASYSDVAGLHIDDEEAHLAVGTPSGDGYAVECHRVALPRGAVESGYVVDVDAVGDTLRRAVVAMSVRPRQTSLVLSSRRTVCRVAPVVGEQRASAIAESTERLNRYVIFGGKPTVAASAVQGAPEGNSGAAWLVSAATVRELLLRQLAVAKRAGLAVVRVEPALVAVARMLMAAGRPAPPRFVLLACGQGCEVAILRQDGLILCQQPPDALVFADHGDRLVPLLEQMTDHHLRHAQGTELIEELLCCGPADGFDGLFDRLHDAGIRPQWLDPSGFAGVARLQGEGTATAAQRAALAPAVSAALTEATGTDRLAQVNLLPPVERRVRHPLLSRWALVPIAVTLLLGGGFAAADWLAHRQAAQVTHRLEHPTPEMQLCHRLQLQDSKLKRQRADAELLMSAAARHAGAAFIAELPRRLPADVWLERIDIRRGGQCLIDGRAQAEDVVFRFAALLRGSAHVNSVQIGRTGNERIGELILASFHLEVALALPHATPSKGTPK